MIKLPPCIASNIGYWELLLRLLISGEGRLCMEWGKAKGNKALRPVEILLRPTVTDDHGPCPPASTGIARVLWLWAGLSGFLEMRFVPAILTSPINKERMTVKLEQETVAGISLNFRS